MKDEWRRLIGFSQFDADGDGDISQEELHTGIDKAVTKMDTNGDGKVSREELRQVCDLPPSPPVLLCACI